LERHQEKLDNIASFFKKLTSYRLQDAPGGTEFMTKDEAVLTRGKTVFAEECATCHSSKQPPAGTDADKFFAEEVMRQIS
jgi:mono/diheme cytochrome c family protein